MIANGEKREVVFFPDYTASNPYQTLFYSSVADAYSATPGTIEAALWQQTQAGLDESVIFHLHWEDAIYKHRPEAKDNKVASLNAFFDSAASFKNLGGVFIWTVHNKQPHDSRNILPHKMLCQKLSRLADGIHLHSKAAALEVADIFQIAQNKLHIIPHGNYQPAIREHVDKHDARKRLGIPHEKRVFLFFGRLLDYKGGPELIQAFQSVGDPNSVLWICGKQINHIPIDELPDSAQNRIFVRDAFLPQDELNLHLAASDFAVLPYRDSLTSGSIVLALSLGRPIVTPHHSAFADLVTNRNAILYECRDTDGLANALRRAISMSQAVLQKYEQEALAAADRLDWSYINGCIRKMYEQCTVARK